MNHLPPELTEYIDIKGGLGRIMNNQKIYLKLLNTFIQNDYLDTLCSQAAEGDLAGAEASAHAIKGMAGNLSLPLLYDSSITLDAQLKEGRLEQQTLDAFVARWDKTMEYIRLLIDQMEKGQVVL